MPLPILSSVAVLIRVDLWTDPWCGGFNLWFLNGWFWLVLGALAARSTSL
ncbi:MAG: hypothetical protein ACXV5U_07365 [Ilumatobacteraceae bacterium]